MGNVCLFVADAWAGALDAKRNVWMGWRVDGRDGRVRWTDGLAAWQMCGWAEDRVCGPEEWMGKRHGSPSWFEEWAVRQRGRRRIDVSMDGCVRS